MHTHSGSCYLSIFYFAYSTARLSRMTLTLIQRVLDLLCDGAGQQDDLIVADDVGLDHDTHFAASLHGECLLDALKAGRDLLQILQTLHIALDILAAGARTGSADG